MNILAKISQPSSGRSGDSLSVLPKRDYNLSVAHEDAVDELLFRRVEAVRITHYRACNLEMVTAYDRVVDLEESPWLNEVREQLQRANEPLSDLRHLRLYLDDGPCYEFICHGFEAKTAKST